MLESVRNSIVRGSTSFVVPGQNNSLPRHLFGSHVIFVSEDFLSSGGAPYKKTYDPSYGVAFPHLMFPGSPNMTAFHGVKHLEDVGVHYVRAALAILTSNTTGTKTRVFVPLSVNDNSKLDLFQN